MSSLPSSMSVSSTAISRKVFHASRMLSSCRMCRITVGHSDLPRTIGLKDLSTTSHPSSAPADRSEEHTSELQSRFDLVCRLLLEKKNKINTTAKSTHAAH